jgi:hypothetical protein
LSWTDPFGLNKYVYRRSGVHHQLPSSIARDQGWSPVAVREFDNSGFNPPLHKKPHYREGDTTHDRYNKEVNQFCTDWAKTNKVNPATATADDAKRLMQDLRYNSTPMIMDFNRAIWMRSMLGNTWWYRPTE